MPTGSSNSPRNETVKIIGEVLRHLSYEHTTNSNGTIHIYERTHPTYSRVLLDDSPYLPKVYVLSALAKQVDLDEFKRGAAEMMAEIDAKYPDSSQA